MKGIASAIPSFSCAGAERQDYIKKMEAGVSGCSEEGLAESEKYFGLFLLETNNMDASCEEVFCKYKERWSIETYYNYVRNDADFKDSKRAVKS